METISRILSSVTGMEADVSLAVFQVFLHRYLQQERVVVVFPGSERESISVVVTQLKDQDTFSDVQAQVRNSLQAEKISWVFQNADTVVNQVAARFQVVFHYLHESDTSDSLVGQIPGTILELECACGASGFETRWHFNPAWYRADEVSRMAACFDVFVQNLQTANNTPCVQIPLISAAEQKTWINDWNQTAAEYPRQATIHEMIESQVERSPDVCAAIFNQNRVTYAELDRRANQIAHALMDAGVLVGTPVGLYLDRDLDMLAAQLGILKAGAAYAALDTQYPRELLERLFGVVSLPFILTNTRLAENLPDSQSKTLMLDDEWLNSFSDTRPSLLINSDSPAFILFTSGSTGLPKGVVHTHRNMVARFQAAWKLADLTSDDVISQTSPLSSIDGVDEIFSPLMRGARIMMLPHDVVTDPHRLVTALEQGGVTRMILVPSLLRIILALDEPGLAYRLRYLRTWLIGGEPLTNAMAKLFYEKLPQARLINFYGLTEGDALSHLVRPDVDYPIAPPIGRPIQNTKVYLLDERMLPVPLGVTGEICVASEGLFKEYYGRPDLNTQKWIVNPFDPQGLRLFKTGDLGRLTQDGCVEYVGRRDRMVKIRSFRVELGEIEAALYRHAAVRECFVAAREVKSSAVRSASLTHQVRLVAYVVLGEPVPEQKLRQFMREILPDYAMPAAFLFLEALPLSPNGKVDLSALPEISDSFDIQENFVAPRDPVETEIAEIWSALLQRHPISVDDNFFDIGGDSLAAVDLVLQLEKKYQRSLPISVLMQSPTIAGLADLIHSDRNVQWSSLVPIRPQGNRPPLFCIHADGGVLFYYNFARSMPEGIPVYGLQARGLIGGHRPHTNVCEMAADYIAEMKTVQPNGPYHLVAYSLGGMVSLEIGNQLIALGEQVAFIGLLDAYGPNYPQLTSAGNLFSYKVSVHANTLKVNSLRGKLKYLWIRATKRTGIVISNLFGDLFMALHLPLPHIIRYNYVSRILNDVVYDHNLDPHPGVVTIFRASIQPENIIPDPSLGWDEYVSGELKIVNVTGTHNSIMGEPHLRLLVEAVLGELDKLPLRG